MKTQKILLLRIVFVLISYLLIVFGAQPSRAQPPFFFENNPMTRMDSQNVCPESTDLGLTEVQNKALKDLQQAYASKALPLRRELMSLRFELRYLVRDPNFQPKILLDRQKKISELQAKLGNLSLCYQIKARSIFTKEQLAKLPQNCSLGIEVLYEMGVRRSKQKGSR